MVCTKCLHHKEGFESTKQKDNLSVLKLLHSTEPTDALIYNNTTFSGTDLFEIGKTADFQHHGCSWMTCNQFSDSK